MPSSQSTHCSRVQLDTGPSGIFDFDSLQVSIEFFFILSFPLSHQSCMLRYIILAPVSFSIIFDKKFLLRSGSYIIVVNKMFKKITTFYESPPGL